MIATVPIYEIQEVVEDHEEELNTDRRMMGAERMITEYDEEIDIEVISSEISKYIEYAVSLLVTLVLVELQLILQFELVICLIPIFLVELRSMFLHSMRIYSSYQNDETEHDKNSEIKNLINSCANFLFCILLCIFYYNQGKFYFLFTSIPNCIALVAHFLIKMKVSVQCQLFSIICETAGKLLKISLLISIGIRIDNIAYLSWVSALWPLWIALACLAVLSIGSFLLLITSALSYYYSDTLKSEVYSCIWLTYTTSALSITTFLFGLDLIESKYQYLPLYYISYLIGFLFVTFYYKSDLQKWWKTFFMENEQYSIPSLSSSSPLPLPPSQAQHMKLSTKIIRAIKLPPRALVRMSSTYFQPASPKEPPKSIRTMSHEIKESLAKEEIHFRSLSSLPRENINNRKGSFDNSFVDKKCGICFEAECNSVFLDCGHGGICHNCAKILMSEKRVCHLCRNPIVQVVKIKVEPGKVLNVIGTNSN